jgi:hypothetical protein
VYIHFQTPAALVFEWTFTLASHLAPHLAILAIWDQDDRQIKHPGVRGVPPPGVIISACLLEVREQEIVGMVNSVEVNVRPEALVLIRRGCLGGYWCGGRSWRFRGGRAWMPCFAVIYLRTNDYLLT